MTGIETTGTIRQYTVIVNGTEYTNAHSRKEAYRIRDEVRRKLPSAAIDVVPTVKRTSIDVRVEPCVRISATDEVSAIAKRVGEQLKARMSDACRKHQDDDCNERRPQ